MIIENLEALKTWLSKTLEPIRCDADPSALAKYVVALVKKDKSEKELKALCIDQLDVFLQKETQTFVDKLFEAVNAKSYLPQPEQPTSARTETQQRTEKDESKRDEPSRDEDREKKFSRRINHSPPSSSRYSRDSRRVDDRKKEDRSRKREYDRNPPRRDSYRERYNRRRERSRSYSRSRSRSWSKDRTRERDRDRERDRTRSRSHSQSRCRSRSREQDSGKPKYEHSRPERQEAVTTDGYTATPLTPGSSSAHFPVPTLSSTITVIAPTHHGNNTTESWSEFPQDHTPFGRGGPPRKRCRDYDGPPPPLPALQPSGMDAPPNSITSSVPTIVTSGVRPPLSQPPPPLFTSDSFEPEVYNPEAPSMTSRPMYRHRVNAQRPNLIGLTMGEVDLPPREKMSNTNSARIVLESDSRKRGAGLHDGAIPAKKP
ncbi:hypothetical protein cypCar_00009941 [Cyprinus carpio]|nr:hypothetical protein cypCar_00009941 [Cyprinus carpio]